LNVSGHRYVFDILHGSGKLGQYLIFASWAVRN
jgi:hypothetical protein